MCACKTVWDEIRETVHAGHCLKKSMRVARQSQRALARVSLKIIFGYIM